GAFVNINAPGSPPLGITWYWQTTPSGTSLSNSSTSLTINITGDYYLRPRSGSGCWGAATPVVHATFNPGISNNSITVGQTICSGNSPSTLIGTSPAGGSGIYVFGWQESTDGGASWANASGSNQGINYAPPALTTTTQYKRWITSDPCPASVSNIINIIVQPQIDPGTSSADQSICYNTTPVALTNSGASGGTGAYNYQWQQSVGCSGTWSDIGGATAYSYGFPGNLTSTTCFRRKVSSGVCLAAYSNIVTITVYPDLAPGSVAANQTICYNAVPAGFYETGSASGGTGSFAYQWQQQPGCSGGWADLSGGNATAYTYSANLTQTTCFRRRVISGACSAVYSNVITVTVYADVTPGSVAVNQSICYGTNPAAFTNSALPAGGNGAYGYQWQQQPNCSGGWSDISSATATTYQAGILIQNTCYRRKVVNLCSTVYSNTIQITVYAQFNGGSVGSNQTIPYNTAPATFSQLSAPFGGTGALSYQWQIQPNCSGGWTDIGGATASTLNYATSLTANTCFRRNATNTCGIVSSNVITVLVQGAVTGGSIGVDQTICYNSAPAQFDNLVSPTGGSGIYNYQWEIQPNCSGGWTDISGAIGIIYTHTPLTVTTCFRRKATSSGQSAYSNTLTVTVYPILTAGSVGSNQTICYNTAPAAFTQLSAPTGGTGSYTYQWQSQPGCAGGWGNIGGATASTYQSGSLTQTTCFLRNTTSNSCGTVSSNTIQVNVYANLTAGSVGSNQSICYNSSPSAFSQFATPSGGTGSYTYQWQIQPNCSGGWTDIGGATATTYDDPGNLTQTTCYRRNETSGSCGTVISNAIIVTVYADLTSGSVAANQTICYNTAPAQFTSTGNPTGGTGSYNYQWQIQLNCSGGWSDIGSATSNIYTHFALTQTTCFRRNVTSGACGTVSSNTITVTVYADLTSGSIAANQTICYNTVPAAFTQLSAPAGGTGTYAYQWQSQPGCAGGWGDIGGATASTYQAVSLTQTTCYRRNVTSGSCGTVSSNSVQVSVYADLTPGSVVSNQSICYNTSPSAFSQTVPPSGGTGTYGYQWQIQPGCSGAWSSIGGATATTYDEPGNLIQTTCYKRNVTSGTCGTVSSNTITVIVYGNLAGGTVSSSQTICFNQNAAGFTNTVSPSGGSGSYNYQWQIQPLCSGGWSNILGAISNIYTHPSVFTQTTCFRREVTDICGVVYSNTITVTVNPLPIVSFSGLAGPYCISQVTPVPLSGLPVGGTFSGNGISGNNFIPYYAAVGANTIVYTYTDGNTCTNSTSQSVSIIGLPTVDFSGLAGPYCVSNSTPITLTGYPIGGTFSGPGISGNAFVPSLAGVGVHTITYTYSDINGCTNTKSRTAVVNPMPAITFSGLQPSYCINNSTVTLTGFPAGGTFSGPGISGNIFNPATAGAGFHTITYTYTDGIGCSNFTQQTTTVHALPTPSFSGLNATYCFEASPALLTGSPSGGTFSGSGISGNYFYPNVAGSGLQIITYTFTDGFSCVNSSSQSTTVYSQLTSGTVGSNQTICYNTSPAAFTQTAAPAGGTGAYTYQWQEQPLCAGGWSDISGATASTYDVPGNLTQNYCYRRNVTSSSCGTVITNTIAVYVYADLTPGSVAADETICYNTSPAAFTQITAPTNGNGSYAYQWQQQPGCSGAWSDIGGATATTYDVPGNIIQTTCYRRRVISGGGCGTVYSNTITVTVFANLTPGSVAADQTICYNATPVTFTNTTSPSGGTGSFAYQWQIQPGCSGVWSDIAGATSDVYTSTALTQTSCFRRRVISGTCGTVYSNTITVTVYANLTSGTVAADQTICYNTSPAAFTQSVAPLGGNGSYTYQWQEQPACVGGWGDILGATASTYDVPGNLIQTTCYRRNVTSGSCGTVTSNVITVTVYADLTPGSVAADETICYNTSPAAFTQITA
ncbi:MAG: hypothetical protein WCM93_13670, partial [Bacteroidota bacterium]